jgi:UDP-GlcNAc:undecaprenyl-phosphate GlcNAc-1-phosphate transferase
LAFLCFNRHPAHIFAGDCGSGTVGFLLGLLSLPLLRTGGGRFLAVLLIFAYPLTDLGTAIMRRLLKGKSPFSADRGHLHHRIFDAGVSHVGCTTVLLTVSATMGVIGVLLCDPQLWGGAAVACILGAGTLIVLRRYVLNFS